MKIKQIMENEIVHINFNRFTIFRKVDCELSNDVFITWITWVFLRMQMVLKYKKNEILFYFIK